MLVSEEEHYCTRIVQFIPIRNYIDYIIAYQLLIIVYVIALLIHFLYFIDIDILMTTLVLSILVANRKQYSVNLCCTVNQNYQLYEMLDATCLLICKLLVCIYIHFVKVWYFRDIYQVYDSEIFHFFCNII